MNFKKRKMIEIIDRRSFLMTTFAVLAGCKTGKKTEHSETAGKPGKNKNIQPLKPNPSSKTEPVVKNEVPKISSSSSEKITVTKDQNVYFTRDLTPYGVMKVYKKISHHVRGKIGFKVHFGEDGNVTYIRPEMMKKLVKKLKANLVETNVLYVGKRRYTKSHIKLAKDHGFTFAPIDILDSEGDMELKVDYRHYKKIRIGKHTANYDMFVIFSHFKGHGSAGFGGAIKNVSMGLGSIAGKMAMHASTIPSYDPKKCISCGICVKKCPASAITLKPLKIDPKKCIGCAACIGECPYRVFRVPFGTTAPKVFHERLVEYAKAISDYKPCVYINVLANITRKCDCMGSPQKPFMDDIGILAGTDIVAMDQASLDLVNKKHNCNDTFLKESNMSGNHQLAYAEKIGLGKRKYVMHDLDIERIPLKVEKK
ncbi:MAG: DUF362 domain-containing protein [Deltaproteobacteria bacterium]|nr:DUF362 domain-containing protein [Deltaproteobacteria bacterium]